MSSRKEIGAPSNIHSHEGTVPFGRGMQDRARASSECCCLPTYLSFARGGKAATYAEFSRSFIFTCNLSLDAGGGMIGVRWLCSLPKIPKVPQTPRHTFWRGSLSQAELPSHLRAALSSPQCLPRSFFACSMTYLVPSAQVGVTSWFPRLHIFSGCCFLLLLAPPSYLLFPPYQLL